MADDQASGSEWSVEHNNGSPETVVSRRRLVTALGVGAVTALAGCGGGDGATATPTPTESPTATETPTDTPTVTPTPQMLIGGKELSKFNKTPDLGIEDQGPGLAESKWDSYGQSFTVEEGFTEVGIKAANYGQPGSEYTITLYSGEPSEGNLSEIASQDQVGFEDNSFQAYDFNTDEGGTYYLEMSDPVGFPTWWWNIEDPPDFGGSSYLSRTLTENTELYSGKSPTFWIWVLG